MCARGARLLVVGERGGGRRAGRAAGPTPEELGPLPPHPVPRLVGGEPVAVGHDCRARHPRVVALVAGREPARDLEVRANSASVWRAGGRRAQELDVDPWASPVSIVGRARSLTFAFCAARKSARAWSRSCTSWSTRRHGVGRASRRPCSRGGASPRRRAGGAASPRRRSRRRPPSRRAPSARSSALRATGPMTRCRGRDTARAAPGRAAARCRRSACGRRRRSSARGSGSTRRCRSPPRCR